jgi:hypothetical protein
MGSTNVGLTATPAAFGLTPRLSRGYNLSAFHSPERAKGGRQMVKVNHAKFGLFGLAAGLVAGA